MSSVTPSAVESGLRLKRSAVTVSGLSLLRLSFQTLGIIYSDIGTSPLYVLNGIWPASGDVPSEEDVIGGVSAIVWFFTLIPLIKYILISLFFGTKEGEGGTFALFQSLYPPEDKDFDADRTLTGDSANKELSSSEEASRLKKKLRWPLLVWCLFGTSLTMSDGIFTPAVSVTSAVGGIAVAQPSVSGNIVPIAIAILLLLFYSQQFGTARLGFTFAPITFVWFLLLAGTGIYNITTFPGILRAFDPSRAVLFFVRTGRYDALSGILLAVTGSEAIFANLGQFNALSIQISFCCLVYPSLILAYLGQGARLVDSGASVIDNVFYRTIPGPVDGPLYWIVFVVAILATVTASQAMITATFSLIQQVVNMKGLPPIRMHYTSETIQGQVFIPAVNWTLMVAIIVVVAAFTDLAAMTNAYGFAVATVMLSTTGLLAVLMVFVKKWPLIMAIGFFLFYGFIDGLFWGASIQKIPHGAWVPLVIGTVLASTMLLWTWGKGLEDEFDGANRQNLRHFIYHDQKEQTLGSFRRTHREPSQQEENVEEVEDNPDEPEPMDYYYLPRSTSSTGDPVGNILESKQRLVRIPTCAVFHKMAWGRGVPHSFIGFIRQWPALPEVLIFLSVAVLPVARVEADKRYVVTKVRSIEGCYGVTYFIGFRDKFDIRMDELMEQLCQLETLIDPVSSKYAVETVKRVAQRSTHIVPHYHIVSKRKAGGPLTKITNRVRRYFIESIYFRLATMFPETANWLTSADEIIRVGINAVI